MDGITTYDYDDVNRLCLELTDELEGWAVLNVNLRPFYAEGSKTIAFEIAQQLARLGVDVIEAGFPIASPGDFEAVEKIAQEVDGPTICGLARAAGVKPEIEVFDTGNLWLAKQMLAEGLIDRPPLFQLCMGIPWGVPADVRLMKAMVDLLPAGANWTAFGIGRMQMPFAAQASTKSGFSLSIPYPGWIASAPQALATRMISSMER